MDEQYGMPPIQKNKKTVGLGKLIVIAVLCAVAGGVGGGLAVGHMLTENLTESGSTTAAPAAPTSVSAVNLSGNLSDGPSTVYAGNVDSVVGITGTSTTTNIFGQISSSAVSGSGFVYSEDGYIVTNAHVVADVSDLQVMLRDGTAYNATVIGADTDNDVALLKVDAEGLQPVQLGDSDQLVVGEMVCAIGNPLGELTHSLTVGYISALDRSVNTDGTPKTMLQTDAAINPGNSGGPLFDLSGNVVGITTAKYASSSVEGLGFAIPINDAMKIVADLQTYGYTTGKPSLGVSVKNMDASTAAVYNLPVGSYVYGVYAGGAAQTAGIQPGDIITKLGDAEVSSNTDLLSALRSYGAGDSVTVTVYRAGQVLEIPLTLDEAQQEETRELITGEEESGQQSTPQQEQPSGDSGYSYGFPFSWFGW